MSQNKKQSFLARKNIVLSPKLYFVDCMSSLALGLFSTLLISTIFSTIGKYAVEVSFLENVGAFLNEAAAFAKAATGQFISGILMPFLCPSGLTANFQVFFQRPLSTRLFAKEAYRCRTE